MRLYLRNVAANITRLSVFILIFILLLFFKTISAIFRIPPLLSVKTKKTPISAQQLTSIDSNENINTLYNINPESTSCNPKNNNSNQIPNYTRPRRRSFSLIDNVKHHNDMPIVNVPTSRMDSDCIVKKNLKDILKNYGADTTKVNTTNGSNLDQQALKIVQILQENILAHGNKKILDNKNPSENETNDVYKAILSTIENGGGIEYIPVIEDILLSNSRKEKKVTFQ